jgi:hypothetical protein
MKNYFKGIKQIKKGTSKMISGLRYLKSGRNLLTEANKDVKEGVAIIKQRAISYKDSLKDRLVNSGRAIKSRVVETRDYVKQKIFNTGKVEIVQDMHVTFGDRVRRYYYNVREKINQTLSFSWSKPVEATVNATVNATDFLSSAKYKLSKLINRISELFAFRYLNERIAAEAANK